MNNVCPILLYLIEFLHQTTTVEIASNAILELYLIEFLHQTTTCCCEGCCRWCCILLNFYIKPQPPFAAKRSVFSCILLNFYIKPQPYASPRKTWLRCILLNFYIKPQHSNCTCPAIWRCILLNFYIKPQRRRSLPRVWRRCILLNFYIKPQHTPCAMLFRLRCILLNFYIKPQPWAFQRASAAGCILLNFYIKPQRRDGYRLILRILQPFDDSRNLLSVRRRSRFDVFFRISKNKYSKISQKNSNCWGISGFARSLFPQKFRISPYCLSVTARMLV